jgi:hypothetical protein
MFPLTASTVVERWPREKGARLPCRAVRPERGVSRAEDCAETKRGGGRGFAAADAES